LDVVHCLGR